MKPFEYQKEYQNLRNIDQIMRVFNEYERNLYNNNALDFDDLLTKTYELFTTCPDVLDFYTRRFLYILVDEFQDTNKIQYDLTKLLASRHKNLFVVGDEDQSIYSWRGADFTNIFNISKDFEGTKIFKLQQNYRCTKDILNVANKLIALNDDRFDKKLWTDKTGSNPVSFKKYYDEQEEATSIAGTIYSLVEREGYKYSDIAILVRLNALTLPFEEKLLSYNIPHKIYGGFKFFERAEIKNILAYLRIFVNNKDEVSLLRIINFPKRSIGDASIGNLREVANRNGETVLNVILNIERYPELKSLMAKLREFIDTYKELKECYDKLSLLEFVERVIDNFKIKDAFPKDNEDNVDKLLNISQFINSVKMFAETNPNCTLADYLESVTLQSDIDTMGDKDNVVVSTVHAVKGLEFKAVFVVGMEENIFPLARSKDNEKELQEERRLAYVAFTRAEEKLYVSACKTRFMYGRRSYQQESKFLEEAGLSTPMPKRAFMFDDEDDYGFTYKKPNTNQNLGNFGNGYNSGFVGFNTKTNTYMPKPTSAVTGYNSNSNIDITKYKVGQVVAHPKFGEGVIESIGDGGKTANINFAGIGVKTLMLEIAKLTIIK